jgi:hypothetical protein
MKDESGKMKGLAYPEAFIEIPGRSGDSRAFSLSSFIFHLFLR